MPVSAATLAALMQAGVVGDELVNIVRLIDADMGSVHPPTAPGKSSKSARNARYYEAHKDRKATEKRLNKASETGLIQATETTESALIQSPLARVVDITSSTENTGLADAVVDDWPVGDLVTRLSSEIASPRLDPSKAVGLITTSGRLAAWKREGASWHHDVIPVVRGLCSKRGPPISSWKYFDDAIAQSIASNREALKIPAHERPRQDSYTPSATDPRRANTVSRRSAWARIAEERGDLGPGTDEGPDSGGLGRHDGPREGGERLAGPSLNATGRDRA